MFPKQKCEHSGNVPKGPIWLARAILESASNVIGKSRQSVNRFRDDMLEMWLVEVREDELMFDGQDGKTACWTI